MSDTKHTPGPWEATPYGDVMPTGAKYLVASCGGKSGLYRDYKANARLIAAAPELLEALTRLMATHVIGNASLHEPGCRCVVHEAMAAIAKATGSTS